MCYITNIRMAESEDKYSSFSIDFFFIFTYLFSNILSFYLLKIVSVILLKLGCIFTKLMFSYLLYNFNMFAYVYLLYHIACRI